jgi:tetratricopeptide (TPR) repeat protein
LSEHRTSQAVADLLEGKLSPSEARIVVDDLLRGGGPGVEAIWPTVPEDAYEPAIRAALATAEARQREWAAAAEWLSTYYEKGRKPFSDYPRKKKRKLATWGFCEALLTASHALRRDYPLEMVHLAAIAVEAAGLLPIVPFRIERNRDLEARAWGELANAHRVADDLPRAEKALAGAFALYSRGTRDPLLMARLRDVAASLYAAQRRFEEAYHALAVARSIFLHAGDRHRAGRTLIKAGLFRGYAGEPDAAIDLLLRGLKEIDRDRDPDLTYRSLHNLVLFAADSEDLEAAREFLLTLRPIAVQHATRLERIRLTTVEGTIAAGLGNLAEAENAFEEARQAFTKEALHHHAAYTGLHLAAVWFRQGKTAEIRGIVAELVASFSRVQVEEEALAALILLHKAVAQDRATLELIEKTRALFGRLAEGPRRPAPSR